MSAPRSSGEERLRRELGWVVASAAVVNATVGTGIFRLPGPVARQVGSGDLAIVVWAVGGVIALAGALSIAELGAAMPRAGGLYEYLRRAYGPAVGFSLVWAKLVLLIPSAVGGFARLAGEATSALLGLEEDARRDQLFAILFIAVSAALNLVRVRLSTLQQALITIAKYTGILVLAGAGFWLGAGSVAPPTEVAPAAGHATPLAFCLSIVAVMWAFDGWADLSGLAGELRTPQRTFPRALLCGVLAVLALYLAVNVGLLRALGEDGLMASTTGENLAASRVAAAAFGETGMRLLNALILLSCFGACLSSLLTNSRLFVPLSSDGQIPVWLGAVSQRSGVPKHAILTGAALAMVYVSARSFEQLTEGFVVGSFPFYALVVYGVIVLRKREPSLPRPFRVPLYPLTPLVFLIGALAVMAGGLWSSDWVLLASLGVVALGLPLRKLWLLRSARR